jgi:hypothetical protein
MLITKISRQNTLHTTSHINLTPLLDSCKNQGGLCCSNIELQSGPYRNQAAMVSSSYNNLLDMVTSTVDKASALAVLRW